MTQEEIDNAARLYEEEFYGYSVEDEWIKTDFHGYQDIVDVDNAFKAGVEWAIEQLVK